jgi:hypothetical protein
MRALAPESALTATGPAAAEVVLPKAVKIDARPFANPHISIEGEAPMAGFVLRSIPLDREPRIMFGAVRGNPGHAATCGPDRGPNDDLFIFGWLRVEGELAYELPPGRYVWTAVTDGSPLRVRMQLPELRGALEITPDLPAAVQVRTLDAEQAGPPTSTVFSGAGVLATPGVLIGRMTPRTQRSRRRDAHACSEVQRNHLASAPPATDPPCARTPTTGSR